MKIEKKFIKNYIPSNVKAIVVSGKGGVGKSTFSQQVLAPFFYLNNGGKTVKYIEIDDVNKSTSLEESEIIQSSKIRVKEEMEISYSIFEDANIVFDIGGNIVAESIINTIGENGELDDLFWFVPLKSSEEDARKAYNTYVQIINIYKNLGLEPKILFVLSDSNSNPNEGEYDKDLRNEFAYFFGSDWMKLDFVLCDYIKSDKFNYIVIPSFNHLTPCEYLKKSSFELGAAEYIKEVTDKFKELQEQSRSENDAEKKEKLELEKKNLFHQKYTLGKISKFAYGEIMKQFPSLKSFFLK